jgi:hypothetical protein
VPQLSDGDRAVLIGRPPHQEVQGRAQRPRPEVPVHHERLSQIVRLKKRSGEALEGLSCAEPSGRDQDHEPRTAQKGRDMLFLQKRILQFACAHQNSLQKFGQKEEDGNSLQLI